MSDFVLRRVEAGSFAGVDAGAVPPWGDVIAAASPRRGKAWTDEAFALEMLSLHERLGASTESLENLRRLSAGEAGCVITGQQPGMLGGPLYSAYKAAGAVGLARAVSRESGKIIVPVFWCGADDSDFDEVRSAWLWQARQGAVRVELPEDLLPADRRVGSLNDPMVDERERGALEHLFGEAARRAALRVQDGLDARLDFGERSCARMLRAFERAGLVVVDARSPRLRALGQPLFERYIAAHEALSAALLAKRRELLGQGQPAPIAEDALGSALFRLDGEQRRKLAGSELSRLAAERPGDLAASVSLRPIWQDALLGPVAAVLGPSELAYHRQLTPLYAGLGVQPSLRLPRPHVAQLPTGLWDELKLGAGQGRLAALLDSQESTRRLLREHALDTTATARLAALQASVAGSFDGTAAEQGPAVADALASSRRRILRELERLRAEWGDLALETRLTAGMRWDELPKFLFPRGKFQERALASAFGFALFREDWPRWLDALADAAGEDYVGGRPPCFVSDFDLDAS
jgi:hypothetical protein